MIDEENLSSNNNSHSKRSEFISKYVLSYIFYIHIILLISLSIIEIRFSRIYQDQCTIDNRIILHLLLIGIIQIIYSCNGILLIIFSVFYRKYPRLTSLLYIDFLINQILLLFLFIWFLIGNYLVFHIKNQVQSENQYNIVTYCHFLLYEVAFWLNIIYYILIVLFSLVLIFTNMKWFLKQFKNWKNQMAAFKENTPEQF